MDLDLLLGYTEQMQTEFRNLAEASLAEIHIMARDTSLPAPVSIYAQFMAAFMTGDLEKMNSILPSFSSLMKKNTEPVARDLFDLAHLRIKLRGANLTVADIERAQEIIYFDVLEAEKYFVISRGWELLGNEERSIQSANHSSQLYRKFSCPKKSLRAFYNSVVAESRLTPYKNFISEYQSVILQSREVKDSAFEGMALSMLAREYQIVGLFEKSLATINEGLALLEQERGSLHYFNCLLQKAHVLIDLKKPEPAKNLLLEARMSSFPETRAARTLLECALDPSVTWPTELEKHLLPTWKERLPDLLAAPQVSIEMQDSPTSLEFKVLKNLWSGPLSKWDLIEKIYPEESDSVLIENRFKNLVARLRKKFPDLLQFRDNRYFIRKKENLELSSLIGEIE